jgi:hypothetical protein
MVAVGIEEMVGSDWVPDRSDHELGWEGQPINESEMAFLPSARRSMVEKCLTDIVRDGDVTAETA